MKSVSIIIVHWNAFIQLSKLLEQLSENTSDIEIIVVDNNSEQSLTSLQKKYKDVIWVKNNKNYGFSFACNQGVLKAQGKWLFFLNPDVSISLDELRSLIISAEQKKFDAASPISTAPGYSKPLPNWLSLVREFTPLKWLPQTTRKKTLIGGLLLIKKDILIKIGGWDERFFLWFEDSDLTKRLHQAGYKVGFVDQQIKHQGGSSLKKLADQTQKDVFFISMKQYAGKYFNQWQRTIINLISNHYTTRKALPILKQNAAIVVPNLKLKLLTSFLEKNLEYISKDDELIVVTSALAPYKVWNWRKKYPTVRFILLQKNKGFAATVNTGFLAAPCQWLATTNDDVELEKKWLKKLVSIKEEKIGSINPVILNFNQKVESAGINISTKGKAEPITNIPPEHTTETDATNAACVVYTNKALSKVGLFDQKFGSYLEDIDLSLRLRKAGFKNLINTNVTIKHLKHQTSKDFHLLKKINDAKNWWLIILKSWPRKTLLLKFPQILLERLKNIYGIIK